MRHWDSEPVGVEVNLITIYFERRCSALYIETSLLVSDLSPTVRQPIEPRIVTLGPSGVIHEISIRHQQTRFIIIRDRNHDINGVFRNHDFSPRLAPICAVGDIRLTDDHRITHSIHAAHIELNGFYRLTAGAKNYRLCRVRRSPPT